MWYNQPVETDSPSPVTPAAHDAHGVSSGSPSSDPTELFGLVAPRYRVLSLLGKGGMGRVYLANDLLLMRDVALKVLRMDASEVLRGRFQREAIVTASLRHPSIVPVHDYGELPDGRLYYAMRLVQGRTLQQAATQGAGRRKLIRWLRDACEAVSYAHDKGIIHRDLKPENILVGAFGVIHVVDWGLAGRVGMPLPGEPQKTGVRRNDIDNITQEGELLGTPRYMSPQLLQGEPGTFGSDVWALGVTMLEVLTGQEACVGTECTEMERQGRFLELARQLPHELSAIAAKALQYRSAQRYAHAGEMAVDLSNYLEGRPVQAHQYSTRDHFVRVLKAWKLPISMALAAAGMALGASAMSYVQLQQAGEEVQHDLERKEREYEDLAARQQDLQAITAMQLLREHRSEEAFQQAFTAAQAGNVKALGVMAGSHEIRQPQLLDTRTLACEHADFIGPGGQLACPTQDGWAPLNPSGALTELRFSRDGTLHRGIDGVFWHLEGSQGRLEEVRLTGGEWTRREYPWPAGPRSYEGLESLAADRGVVAWRHARLRVFQRGDAWEDTVARTVPDIQDWATTPRGDIIGVRYREAVIGVELVGFDADLTEQFAWPVDAGRLRSVAAMVTLRDGDMVVLLSYEGVLVTMDTRTGQVVSEFDGGELGLMSRLQAHPGGDELLLFGHKGELYHYDAVAGAMVGKHPKPVRDAQMQADGTYWTLSGTEAHHWEPASRRPPKALHLSHGVADLAVSPSGRLLAVGQADGPVRVYDLPRRKLLHHLHWLPGVDAIHAVGLTDSVVVASAGAPAVARAFELSSGQLIEALNLHPCGEQTPNRFREIRGLSDGRFALVPASGDAVVLYAPGGAEDGCIFGDGDAGGPDEPAIRLLRTSAAADVLYFVEGAAGHEGELYRAAAPDWTAERVASMPSDLRDLRVSSDGTHIVLTLPDRVEVREGVSGRLARLFPELKGVSGAAAHMGKGLLAVTSPNGMLQIHDFVSDVPRATMKLHKSGMHAPLFVGDDGRWLVSAGFDPFVRLWDLGVLEEIPRGDQDAIGLSLPR